MRQDTLDLLKDFAHGLVEPWQNTRAVAAKDPVPQIGVRQGDVAVYVAGRPWPD